MLNAVKAKLEKSKKFIQDHQTGIACASTAVAMYAVFRNSNSNAHELIKAQRRSFNELEMENWIITDFLEAKNLKPEYFEFARKHEFYL